MTATEVAYKQMKYDARAKYRMNQEARRHNLATENQAVDELKQRKAESNRDYYIKRRTISETERSNQARETETHRANVAKEKEATRSALVDEAERERSNRAREEETSRSNQARERETERSNRQREFEENRSNVARERENYRSNTAKEGLKARELTEQERSNAARESEQRRTNRVNEGLTKKQAQANALRAAADIARLYGSTSTTADSTASGDEGTQRYDIGAELGANVDGSASLKAMANGLAGGGGGDMGLSGLSGGLGLGAAVRALITGSYANTQKKSTSSGSTSTRVTQSNDTNINRIMKSLGFGGDYMSTNR